MMAVIFSSWARVRTKNQTCSTGTTSSNCETAARATVVTVSPVEFGDQVHVQAHGSTLLVLWGERCRSIGDRLGTDG